MKLTTKLLASFGAALATSSPLIAQQAPGSEQSHGDPFTPVGFLTVTPTVVQPGVRPAMTWGIEFPKSIPDLVVIDSAGSMTTINDKTDKVTVRVAGVSYAYEGTDLEVALWIRVNNGSWNLVFYGTESQVDAGDAVFSQTVQTGTKIDLAARGRTPGGGWSNTQWTISQTPNVAALINDDPLPAESPAFTSGQTESFMSQYVDDNNEVVAGPRDVVHLFEVGSNDPGTSTFDMQDIVVVSTFGKNNNGHGNNLDGVDVSNPGQGGGGPNGTPDTNPDPDAPGGYVDDEKKWIKKKNNN